MGHIMCCAQIQLVWTPTTGKYRLTEGHEHWPPDVSFGKECVNAMGVYFFGHGGLYVTLDGKGMLYCFVLFSCSF